MERQSDQSRLLEDLHRPVITWDSRGVIQVANAAAHRAHGALPGVLVGHRILDLVAVSQDHPATSPHPAEPLLGTLTGRAWRGQIRLRRCDGRTWPADVDAIPVHDDHGQVVGAVAIVDDLTDEKDAARNLERAYAQQRLASARSELLRQVMSGLSTADTLPQVAAALEPHLVAVEALLRGRARLRVPPDLLAISDGAAFLRREVDLTVGERVLLDDLAAQVALAAGRAHHQTRTREIADQLQSSLSASPLPEVDGVDLAAAYAPGGDELEHVGGDWYDVIPTDDGGVVLLVGDVMGRGVPAATTMIRVRAGIRGLVTVDPDPGVVLSRADALVTRDAEHQFVTALAASLDPTRRTLRLCSAGHIPLLVVHGDGSVERVGEGSGLPLGLVDQHARSVIEVAVEPGATIVLVTDGVVEGRDHDLDEGIDRLARRLREGQSEDLRDVVDDVARFADPALLDDVTVLALRIR
ncbi:MAG: SpoIIE family protein phosphatase [Nocardioides sp.]